MLAGLDPAVLERVWFPLGDQTKTETRAEAARGWPGSRRPAGEPGGVLPRRRRLPRLPGTARAQLGRRADRRHGGPRAGPARRPLALHARPAAWARRRRRRAALRTEDRGAHQHRRRGAAECARSQTRWPHAGAFTSPSRTPTRSSGIARLPCPRASRRLHVASGSICAAGLRRRSGPDGCHLRGRRRRGRGRYHVDDHVTSGA